MTDNLDWLDICRPLTQASESCYLIAYCDPASPMGRAIRSAGLWYSYLSNRRVGAPYERLKATPWTCGWGSTGTDVKKGTVFTQQQADERLDQQLINKAKAVDSLVTVDLLPHQKAAIVDWTYNEGEGSLSSSTMLKQLNAGNFDAAMTELLRWNIAGGQVQPGLVTRRAREKQLFETGAWQT